MQVRIHFHTSLFNCLVQPFLQKFHPLLANFSTDTQTSNPFLPLRCIKKPEIDMTVRLAWALLLCAATALLSGQHGVEHFPVSLAGVTA